MSNRLRVLSVAHTAVDSVAGRLRYDPLADDPTLDLRLVVPQRWYQFGRWYEADPPRATRVPVHPLPVRLPRAGPAHWYLHHYAGLRAFARAFAPDVIHLWEEPWSIVALQGSMLARACGAALVLEVDQNLLKRLPPPFGAIRRHVLARTTLILSRSADATAVVRACGYRGPTAPVAYGVDQTIFAPRHTPLPASPLRLGYVGRLVPEKGLDDVLDAMALARTPVRLAMMGEGPHEAALRRRIAQLGLADRVTLQPWGAPADVATFISEQHVITLMTRTDAVAKEQFGRVIIEAQACGVPVIGSTGGSIPDVVGAGGWIVPERDPAAIATLLNALAGDPDAIAARGLAGQRNVADRFTYANVARSMSEAWREAAARRRTRSDTAEPATGLFPGEPERGAVWANTCSES